MSSFAHMIRVWLDVVFRTEEDEGVPTGMRRLGLRTVLDFFLVGSVVGLAVTEQTVVFFHLAFLGVLVATLRLRLRSFLVRAMVVGTVASVELVAAVEMGRAAVEELWEIPLMGFILIVVYGLKWQHTQLQRRMDESRFRVIAGVAHDIRNPLTVVNGFAQVIGKSAGSFGGEELGEMAGLIADSATEANELIDDLLAASQLQAGALDVTLQPVDAVSVSVSVAVHYQKAGREIPVLDLDGQGQLLCLADELRYRQILRNLLTNSIRYGGSRIEVRVGRDGTTVKVEVVDDGEAIAESDRERIFEPFTQVQRDDRPVGSVGLGLFTSRRLARLMGGDIAYRHDQGMSVFELRLPAVATPFATLTPAES